MSVTAAQGFVASGIAAGIRRRDRRDLAIVRSLPHAVGAAMFTRNKVQAACLQVNRSHLELADPQAVVINSGVANAATGERGKIDALATAAEAARLLDLDTEEVLVLSTGVIGARLPLHKLLPGLEPAVAGLSEAGGADAAEAIMTTDTRSKEAVAARDGFTVGGMTKGSGMIHPDLATMLAVVTTDYPLGPGEAIELLRPAVETSFNAISVDGEPSTNDCVVLLANGASGIARTAATDAAFAAALAEVCSDLARQVVADGEGITVLAEINVTGAVDDAQAKAIARRIATSPLVKTALFGHDANWGRVLMAAGQRALERRLRRRRRRPGDAPLQRHGRPRRGRPDRRRARRLRPELHDRPRPGPRQRACRLPDERPLLRLRPHQRGLPDVSRLVVKVGGSVAEGSATHILDLVSAGHQVCVVHGAGPQISLEMERAGIPVRVRRRAASDARPRRSRSSARRSRRSTPRSARRSATARCRCSGDEIGLEATPVPELGLVGDPLPSGPAEVVSALEAGSIPVVAPIAVGPLNVNADEAAAALALGLRADRLLFLTDVDGLILDGEVVDSIGIDAATELLDGGTLQGGIIPKLGAALTAARGGVPASIGRTAVPA